MRSINAVSIAPHAKSWLSNSRQPRILHIFDQACNLINECREVLSIVTPEIGNGPFNLVIPRLRKSFERISGGNVVLQTSEVFSGYINIESLVLIQEDRLVLGDLTINTADANLWHPRPDWEILHAKRTEIVRRVTSLPRIVERSRGAIYQPALPTHLLSTFSSSISTRDHPASLSAAQKLAGLGSGLTPAGDDFIMGTLYAAWIIHPIDMARIVGEEIVNIAAPLTTSLSAAWLRSAGEGDAGILWHEFFDALIDSNTARIQETMGKILAVGETSGADALAGFISLFVAWMEKADISNG